jgi:hypothetical protein
LLEIDARFLLPQDLEETSENLEKGFVDIEEKLYAG